MKDNSSYVLLAILIVLLAGFFYMPSLTGHQVAGGVPGLVISAASTCPSGYTSAGVLDVKYAYSPSVQNPSSVNDYQYLGFSTTGNILLCIPTNSGNLIVSNTASCQSGYTYIGGISTTQMFAGQTVISKYLCARTASGSPEITLIDANDIYYNPIFSTSCATSYYSAGIVSSGGFSQSFVTGGTGFTNLYKQLCARQYATGSVGPISPTTSGTQIAPSGITGPSGPTTTTTTTQQPTGPSGPTTTTTTTQPSAPIIPTPSTRLVVTANSCSSAIETCSNLKGQFVPGQNTCDGMPAAYSSSGISLDAGWVGLCSDNTLLVSVYDDCSSLRASCPSGYTSVGSIHTAPGVCDQWLEGVDYTNAGINSGWLAFCTRNSDTVITIEKDDCGQVTSLPWGFGNLPYYSTSGIARESCPTGYNPVGTVHTGPGGRCDGMPEGYSTSGKALDSGWLGICVKAITTTPSAPISPTTTTPATCTDGIRNQDETSVDCGGTTCTTRCGSGSSCNLNSDCISGTSCVNNICALSAVPVGEPFIPPTRVGAPVDVPFQSHCFNNITDADETDVDCGGSGCGGCGFNKTCSTTIGYGCVSGLTCSSGRCKRIAGQLCTLSSECASGLSCISGRCSTTPTTTTTTTTPSAPSAPTISTSTGGGGGGRRVSAAAFICGNNRLDFGEECDDGNIFSDDGCSKECKIEYCGDSVIQYGTKEECDPADGVTCSLSCTLIPQIPVKIPEAKPAVQEVYQPTIPVYEPVRESKLGKIAKTGGIIIAVAALGALVTWAIRKKFRRQQRPYVLPVRYSRGSR